MGWTIYNSKGESLVTQEQHDHTAADASGLMTDDEHDGYSEYDEVQHGQRVLPVRVLGSGADTINNIVDAFYGAYLQYTAFF